MNRDRLTRRRFVVTLAALGGVTAASLKPELFSLSLAWAATPGQVAQGVRLAMVRMARLLYPHDALPDEIYADILDRVLSGAATGAGFAKTIDQVAAALAGRSGGNWENADESDQLAAMREIESQPFFTAVRDLVRDGIYNGQAFWEHVGYPGPSKGFGGYLHWGAGEIDWLPEES